MSFETDLPWCLGVSDFYEGGRIDHAVTKVLRKHGRRSYAVWCRELQQVAGFRNTPTVADQTRLDKMSLAHYALWRAACMIFADHVVQRVHRDAVKAWDAEESASVAASGPLVLTATTPTKRPTRSSAAALIADALQAAA